MFRTTVIALALVAACFSSPLLAAPFGATIVGTSSYVPACSSNADTSATVTVDVSSRLLVTIGGATFTPDTSNGYALNYSAQLYRADGTTLVAESYGNLTSVSAQAVALSDSEVLVDPSAFAPYQLSPGSYVLKLSFQTSGSCGGDGPYVDSPKLTYVLLSAAFDRIFASGFAALSDGGEARDADRMTA